MWNSSPNKFSLIEPSLVPEGFQLVHEKSIIVSTKTSNAGYNSFEHCSPSGWKPVDRSPLTKR